MRYLIIVLMGVMLAGCAVIGPEMAVSSFRQECIRQWGPERYWTASQRNYFLDRSQMLAAQARAQANETTARVGAAVAARPPLIFTTPATAPRYHLVPDGLGGYTAIPNPGF